MRTAPTFRSSETSSATSSLTDTVPDFSGRLRPSGRVAILVSRYNELITSRLLEGALACCGEAGVARDQIDVVWVPGAFELPSAAAAANPPRAVGISGSRCQVFEAGEYASSAATFAGARPPTTKIRSPL